MPDLERLTRFVNEAPAGTMVPVDSLREFLAGETVKAAPEEERRLTPAEAAEWLHRHLGGRKRGAAAVRKAMRTGFRGVVLKSYPYGRERRTTESDLRHFAAKIGALPFSDGSKQIAPSVLAPPSAPAGLMEQVRNDPADEIAAAQERFRQRRQESSGQSARQRRSATGGG